MASVPGGDRLGLLGSGAGGGGGPAGSLLERPGAALSKAQLEERIYRWGEEVESNAVEVHVHNLRKKLGNETIRTLRGIGYALSAVSEV